VCEGKIYLFIFPFITKALNVSFSITRLYYLSNTDHALLVANRHKRLLLLLESVYRLPYNLYCVGGDVKHCSIQY